MNKIENKFIGRITLQPFSGVLSSYKDHQGHYLDFSDMTGACYLAPDTISALYMLNERVRQSSGSLHITEAYRSWETQAQAHDDWVTGKHKAYVAPPGHSFHEAGRAIDIDVSALNFAGTEQSCQLSKFWSIALSCGWYPIISEPNAQTSECWHFEHPGPWTDRRQREPNGRVAMLACLDIGHWNPHVSQDMFILFFIESQLNRILPFHVQVQADNSWRQYLKYLKLPEDISVEQAAQKLKSM